MGMLLLWIAEYVVAFALVALFILRALSLMRWVVNRISK